MKYYVALGLIVIAGVVPFSSRAVFMDEHIFLRIAETAQHNWLFPQDTPSVFFGMPLANYAGNTHPPVGEYYLAFITALIGDFDERPYRLMFSVFSVLAVLAFYDLARRFTQQPFWVAVLFALCPAFFVMSPTLMMDIPMLAFILLGIAFYFRHMEGRKYGLVVAALCWILAAGTGYTALVPLACLGLQMLLAKRPLRELVAIALPPLMLVVWQLAMTGHFGATPVIQTIEWYRKQGDILHNAAATLSFLGSVALFPWTVLAVSGFPRLRTVAAAFLPAIVFALLKAPSSLWMQAWYVIMAVSGLLIVWAFVRASNHVIAGGRNRGEAFLMLWVPATLLFFIVVADMINARYVLLTIPALFLIIFRQSTPRQLTLALIPTALLSLSLAYSDFVFVNAYRDWVHRTVPALQQQGFRLWGVSESGLRFYLEKQAVPTLSYTDLRPKGLDLLVHQNLFQYGLAEDLAVMLTDLKEFRLESSFPIRTFNREAWAGFHDSRLGITPFTFSRTPLDVVRVSQVNPFVASLPQKGVPADDVPAWSPNGVILKQSVDQREFSLKIPANSTLEYDLEGQGMADLHGDRILLRRNGSGTIVWRNFRIVPSRWSM